MHITRFSRHNFRILEGRARVRFIAGYFAVLAAMGQTALMAQDADRKETLPTSMFFDIAAQPLTAALDAYSAAAEMQVIYDGTLASGRSSRAVLGHMSPEAALTRLLDGTGLVVRYAAPHVFTLVEKPAVRDATAPKFEDYMPYLAAIQRSIESAFCGAQLTAPGAYRVKFSFRIDWSGRVVRSELLASSDDGARDRAIVGLLSTLTIDRPPPPDMPQPVVMTVAPRSPAESGDCGASGPSSPRSTIP